MCACAYPFRCLACRGKQPLAFHDCRLMHYQRLGLERDARWHTPGFDTVTQHIDRREQCKLGIVSCHNLIRCVLLAELRAYDLCRRLGEISRPIVHERPALHEQIAAAISRLHC